MKTIAILITLPIILGSCLLSARRLPADTATNLPTPSSTVAARGPVHTPAPSTAIDILSGHLPGFGAGITTIIIGLGIFKAGAKLTPTKKDDQIYNALTRAAKSIGVPAPSPMEGHDQ